MDLSMSDGDWGDEDMRVLLAGAIAIVKHLLRLALLVATLAACVVLYCFVLAWICLFWAQTRLLKQTSNFLERCMVKDTVTTGTKLDNQIDSSTEKAEVTGSSEKGQDGQGITSRSTLLAEVNKIVSPVITAPCSNNTTNSNVHDDAIAREILWGEKELQQCGQALEVEVEARIEAKVQELTSPYDIEWDAEQSTSPANATPVSEDLSPADHDHSVEAVNEEVIDKQPDQDALAVDDEVVDVRTEQEVLIIVDEIAKTHAEQDTLTVNDTLPESIEDTIPAEQLTSEDVQQFDQSAKDDTTPSPVAQPPKDTFRETKPKSNVKPRVSVAEQAKEKLKERKAEGQASFVDSMQTSSIISTKSNTAQTGTTHAQHLKAVWKGENSNPSARNNPLTLIKRTLRGEASSFGTPSAPQGPKLRSTPQAAKPPGPSGQRVLPSRAPVDPATIPPHVRAGQVAKERKVAAQQLAYEAAVKAKAAVPTSNSYAALADDTSSAEAPESSPVNENITEPVSGQENDADSVDVPESSPVNESTTVPVSDEKKDADLAPVQEPVPSPCPAPDPVPQEQVEPTQHAEVQPDQQEEVDPVTAVIEPLPVQPATSAEDNVDKRKLYTAEELKALEASSIKYHGDPVPSRFKDAADLMMSLMSTSNTYPGKPSIRSSANRETTPQAEAFRAAFRGRNPPRILQNRGDSFLSPATEGPIIPKAVETTSAQTIDANQHAHAASSISTYEDLSGLDFGAPATFEGPSPKPSSSGSSNTLPVTPGPLSFFAPGAASLNNLTVQPGSETHEEPMASTRYGYQHTPLQMPQYAAAAYKSACSDAGILDLASEEAFPSLGSVKVKIPAPKPPGYASVDPDAQAKFDALLESPVVQAHLGKFITTATKSSASLNMSYGVAVGETASAAMVYQDQASPSQQAMTKSLHENDEGYPALPKVNIPTVQANGEAALKAERRQMRKHARESLKDAWFDRDEARKKFAGSFELEQAVNLEQQTTLYLEKRSTLQSLMNSGSLNDTDAAMFPELGMLESRPRKAPPGIEEWRARKLQAKTAADAVAEVIEAPPTSLLPGIIKELVQIQGHRDKIADNLKVEGQSDVVYSKNVGSKKRADKLYEKKRKVLVDAYPAGLPAEFEMRFPEVLLDN